MKRLDSQKGERCVFVKKGQCLPFFPNYLNKFLITLRMLNVTCSIEREVLDCQTNRTQGCQ